MTVFENNMGLNLMGDKEGPKLETLDLRGLTADMISETGRRVGFGGLMPPIKVQDWGMSFTFDEDKALLPELEYRDYDNKPRIPAVKMINIIMKKHEEPVMWGGGKFNDGQIFVATNEQDEVDAGVTSKMYDSDTVNIKLPSWLMFKAKSEWRRANHDIIRI